MDITVTSCQIEVRRLNSFADFQQQVLDAFEKVPVSSHYVVLPELVTVGLLTTDENFDSYTARDYRRLAGFLNDYKLFFSQLAAERRQVIIAGSTLEEEDGNIYNTSFVFDEDGGVHKHRKTHIFPGEAAWDTAEGDELQIFDVGPARFGIAICYEMEIPEVASIYQMKGADIIFCPSYTFTPHGFWRVRHCAQARAIENQVYVVQCPTIGPSLGVIQPGFGETSILSPCDLAWTENGVIEESTPENRVITARLSLSELYENRVQGAATTVKDRQRKKELYAKQIQMDVLEGGTR